MNTTWAKDSKVILCVDLNAFYPSCEELRDPLLKGKAHAVIMTDEKKGEITKGVVSSCSYEARKFGVSSAMSLVRARSLCQDLILLPVDIPYYREVSEKVMYVLEGYADVLEQASIDEAYLDCTGQVQNVDVEEFASEVKKAVREKCQLLCSVGVASTKSAAKIACDFKKPDGLTIVYPSQLIEFLSPLTVDTVAGIGPKTQQALKEIGIEALGQLANADIQLLMDRFGKKNGLWMNQVANGTDSEPVVAREDHVSLSTEHTLDNFTRDKQQILDSLKGELASDLISRLLKEKYQFRTVGVKLVRTDFKLETRETTYSEFQNDKESILSVLDQLMDKFSLSSDKLAVRKIGLRVSHLTRSTDPSTNKKSVFARKKPAKILKSQILGQKTILDYMYLD